MVAYDLIKKLEKQPYFNELLKHGIIPINWIDYKVIYEYYLKQRDLGYKIMMACTITADEYNVSERTVKRIVQKMKG